MKKTLAAVLLAGLAAFVVAGIANNDTDNTGTENPAPTSTAPRPTTTTTASDADSYALTQCQNLSNQLDSAWVELGDTLSDAVDAGVSTYVVDAALDTLNSGVEATEAWLNVCSTYLPTKAAHYRTFLAEVKPTLRQLEYYR